MARCTICKKSLDDCTCDFRVKHGLVCAKCGKPIEDCICNFKGKEKTQKSKRMPKAKDIINK